MKKLLLSMLSISALLFSTACSDEDIVKGGDGEQMVQFTVSLNDGSDASRSISDGQTVDKVYYEVYTNVNGTQTPLTALKSSADLQAGTTATGGNKHATITLALVKGQTYDVVFWASKNGVYDTDDLTSIKVNEGNTNDESKDAFTAVKQVTVNGPLKETVYLYRPFAQINFGTKDILTAIAAGATLEQSSIKVTYAADTYNALAEEGVGEGKTVEFGLGQIPNINDEELKLATGESYEYLATAYVLFPGKKTDKVTTDLTLTVPTQLNKDVVIEVPYAPAQRNYRTNVLGNLLTNSAEFTVIVDPIYNTPDNNISIWDGTVAEDVQANTEGVYEIYTASQLAWVAKQVDGGKTFEGETVKLVSDIDLANIAWNPIGIDGDKPGFQGIFDGNGKTIYNLYVDLTETPAYQSAGLFANARYATIKNFTVENAVVKNLITGANASCGTAVVLGSAQSPATIENVSVKNAVVEGNRYVGGIAGYFAGTITACSVDGIEITSAPDDLDKNGAYDNGDKVGGILAYANGAVVLTENKVNNFTIRAYRDMGGIAGCVLAEGSEITKNVASNGTITIDQVTNFYEVKAANAAEIVGRKGSYDLSTNTFDNVTIEEISAVVSTVEQLQAAIDAAVAGENVIVLGADITGDVTVTEKDNVKIVVNGSGHKYDGTISIYGNSGDENAELVVKNVKFETATNEEVFVYGFNTANGDYSRYPDAVTVENCTFTAIGEAVNTAVGVKLAAGRHDFKLTGLTATNMHSLAQFQSHDKAVFVDNVTVTGCKNGISFGNTAYPTLKNSTINTTAYGVRGDGNASRGNLVVENTTINATKPIIIRKMTTDSYAVKLNAAKLVTDELYAVVFTKGDDDAEYVAPTGTYTLTGAEGYNVYPVPAGQTSMTARSNAQISEILSNTGITTINLAEGTYIIPSAAKGKTVTFNGTGNPEDVKVAVTKVGTSGENCDYGLDGSTVTFDGITITTNSSTYIGYARCNGTYKNCIINGTYTLYGDSHFENCTLNVSGDVYNIWTWGAPTATFTNCTFNSDGKAMLLYGTADTNLTINNCVFNDNGGLTDKKAAIEIGNDYGKSYELIVNNTIVNGYEINDKGINTGTTLWGNKNSMGQDKLNVVVDGVDVY